MDAPDARQRLRGRLLILAAAVLWSTSGFFGEARVFDDIPSSHRGLFHAFWRAVFASVVLLPLVRRPRWTMGLVPMVLTFTAMNGTFLTSLTLAGAANAVWLQYTAPAWVFLIGWLALRERVEARDWVMLVLGAMGVATILLGNRWSAPLDAKLGAELGVKLGMDGFLLGLASGLCFAGVIISVRLLREHDPAWLVALNHLGAALLLSPVVIRLGLWPHGIQWLYLAGFGMLQMGVPYVLFARGLRTVSGPEASSISLLEPVLVPVWAFLAWNKIPALATLEGGTLILLGLLYRYWPRPAAARQRRAARPPVRTMPAEGGLVWWKKLLFAFGTATPVVFGATMLGELYCRWTGRGKPPDIAAYIVRWERGGFYVFESTMPETNSDGLRDREHIVENEEGLHRVVCLGDSVTYGYPLSMQASYPWILGERLRESGVRAEVFNVALPGWSVRQARMAYERIARKYRPRVVTLGLCLNDVPEVYNNLTRPPAPIAFLARHSYLARTLTAPLVNREIASVEQLFLESDSPRVERAWRMCENEILALAEEVERDDARFVLVVFPFRFQVLPDAPPPVAQRRLAEFAETHRLPLVDVLPALERHGMDAFADYDHFSKRGAAVVADQLVASGFLADD